jgi:hypothetical protein
VRVVGYERPRLQLLQRIWPDNRLPSHLQHLPIQRPYIGPDGPDPLSEHRNVDSASDNLSTHQQLQ